MDMRVKNRLFAMLAALLFSTAAVATGTSSGIGFDQLDTNKDGLLTAMEASEDDGLSSMWTDADRDRNGTIDRAEFSAFEAMPEQEVAPGGGTMSPPGAANPGTTDPNTTNPGTTNPGSGSYR